MGALTEANWGNLSRRLHLTDDDRERVIKAKDNLNEGFLHLPMSEMPHLKGELAPYYYDWLAHPENDEYWKAVSIEESHSNISVPAYNFPGRDD